MFALEVGDRRAGRSLRHRPDRAPDPQRARRRPRVRPALFSAATSSRACARARALRLGTSATPPRGRGETAVAGRDRRRRLDLPACGCRRRPRSFAVDRTAASSVEIAAADIGTGARTVLTQIAADALGRPLDASTCGSATPASRSPRRRRLGRAPHLGLRDRRRPAARLPRDQIGARPGRGRRGSRRRRRGDQERRSRHSPSAPSSPRSASTSTPARSGCRACSACSPPGGSSTRAPPAHSCIGGMTMGLRWRCTRRACSTRSSATSSTTTWPSTTSPPTRTWLDRGAWVDEDDRRQPDGIKGIGEIGIVGTAAAVANAVHHATGARVRDLPVTLDKLLGACPISAKPSPALVDRHRP